MSRRQDKRDKPHMSLQAVPPGENTSCHHVLMLSPPWKMTCNLGWLEETKEREGEGSEDQTDELPPHGSVWEYWLSLALWLSLSGHHLFREVQHKQQVGFSHGTDRIMLQWCTVMWLSANLQTSSYICINNLSFSVSTSKIKTTSETVIHRHNKDTTTVTCTTSTGLPGCTN